uniref:Uncharacterized protein n=1 Tax=Photinus pyralis TaxID=7054 RepID=A0A1Y1NN88_PHOPY
MPSHLHELMQHARLHRARNRPGPLTPKLTTLYTPSLCSPQPVRSDPEQRLLDAFILTIAMNRFCSCLARPCLGSRSHDRPGSKLPTLLAKASVFGNQVWHTWTTYSPQDGHVMIIPGVLVSLRPNHGGRSVDGYPDITTFCTEYSPAL